MAVYPACAGIDRRIEDEKLLRERLPRMRGDRPPRYTSPGRQPLFTPHARGSTGRKVACKEIKQVYPACAGIDPWLLVSGNLYCGLPRMRGDRPCNTIGVLVMSMFTPHARGSTSDPLSSSGKQSVYPACAGIDRF